MPFRQTSTLFAAARPAASTRVSSGGLPHGLDTAEGLQELLRRHLAHPRDGGELGLEGPLGPQGAVVGDGEAVGLVPEALEQLEHGAGPGDPQGLGAAGAEDQLLLLGQGGPLQLVEAQGRQGALGGVELAQAAVDEDEVRQVPAFVCSRR